MVPKPYLELHVLWYHGFKDIDKIWQGCVCVCVCSTNVPLFCAKVSNDHSIQQKAKPKQKCLRLTLEVQDQVFWFMYSICFFYTCDLWHSSQLPVCLEGWTSSDLAGDLNGGNPCFVEHRATKKSQDHELRFTKETIILGNHIALNKQDWLNFNIQASNDDTFAVNKLC